MATSALKGSATLTYTPPAGSAIDHTFAIPLYQVQPIYRRSRYEWWSEDFDTREVVTVGDGVRDIIGTIRLDNQPVELLDMLESCIENDLTASYVENSVTYPVRIVGIIGAGTDEITIGPDPDRHGYGEWQVRVHLRRTDGGTLSGIFTS